MVSQLSLIISLVFMLYLCHFRVEANSRPFQKRSCWMCDAPRCDKCVTSQWTSWNQCSAPCGLNGYQSRSRVVHQPSSCGVRSCPHLSVKEWRPCNRWCQNGGTPARWGCHCPLNYIGDCCEAAYLGWSGWGDWDQCSKTCGGSGVQKRMRVCVGLLPINSSTCDSVCPGPNLETKECGTHECPVEYNSLGCYRDSTPHALPLLLKSFRNNIDWNDMTKVVLACAEIAKGRGLAIFGIQFYGECWSGLDAENTYNKYGPSEKCWNGVGEKGTYYVYKLRE